VLREKDDLTDVISIVHQLTIHGLNDRVLFTTNQYDFAQIFRLQWLEGVKNTFPAALPVSNHILFLSL
jgi:hypothetical protein